MYSRPKIVMTFKQPWYISRITEPVNSRWIFVNLQQEGLVDEAVFGNVQVAQLLLTM